MARFLPALSVGLSLFFAFLLGMTMGRIPARPPTRIVQDERPKIPVVRIDGVIGSELHGSIHGNARLFIAGKPVMVGSGTFRAPASSIVRVIPGASSGKFVASKRGKKYYSVGSPSAEKLSPANRLYFESAKEAEAAGYVR